MRLWHLIRKKWTFKKNNKVDLLIFDDPPVVFDFKKINYSVYRSDEINIYYLFKSLITLIKSHKKNLNNLSNIYFKLMVSAYDPILTVGKDRFGKILKFTEFFPNKKKIYYEWAYTFKEQITITQFLIKGLSKRLSLKYSRNNNLKKRLKKTQGPDFYFVYDKRSQKFIKQVYQTKVLDMGSIRNNERKTKNFRKEYDFMFISNYRPRPPSDNLRYDKIDKFIDCTTFTIKNLSSYCEENNMKLCIALASNREEKKYKKSELKREELNFYHKYAKNFYTENLDSYSLANKSKMIVCTHSNLGYELLARKKKVFFVNTLKKFDWHFYKKNSNFFYKGNNESKFKKKLFNFSKIDEKKFRKSILRDKKIMKFDKNNKKMKVIISQIIKNEKRGVLSK